MTGILAAYRDWGVIYEMVKEKKTFADIYSQNEEDTAPLKEKEKMVFFLIGEEIGTVTQ